VVFGAVLHVAGLIEILAGVLVLSKFTRMGSATGQCWDWQTKHPAPSHGSLRSTQRPSFPGA
jgi:hypothetical protein